MKSLKSISVALLFIAAMSSMPAMAQAKSTPKLTDPEIASVAVVANQIDVEYAKIALMNSKNSATRKFAQTMIDDHTAIIAKAVALTKNWG